MMIIKTHGYLRFLNGNYPTIASDILTFIFLLVIVGGCSSSRELEEEKLSRTSLKDFLAKYEATFNPSDYNPDINVVLSESKKNNDILPIANIAITVPPETIPGFRVQVLFTTEIAYANQMRDTLDSLLEDDWVYIVYAAPYYRVRVGNFPERYLAESMVKKLVKLGFKRAWTVPDNILLPPPPKPPKTFIIPENQLERFR